MIIRRPIGEKGQVVIPRDIRQLLNLKKEVVFEVVDGNVMIKPEQDPQEFLKDFLDVPKLKRNLTLKDLKKIREEEYELP